MSESDAIRSAQVEHDPSAQQFELHVGGMLCLLQYRMANGKMVVYHTEVPPPIQNRGIAERMTRAALEYARTKNMKIEARCPYTAAFLRSHPEYSDLL
jgi:predicted GNAT family acetyltransferase